MTDVNKTDANTQTIVYSNRLLRERNEEVKNLNLSENKQKTKHKQKTKQQKKKFHFLYIECFWGGRKVLQ